MDVSTKDGEFNKPSVSFHINDWRQPEKDFIGRNRKIQTMISGLRRVPSNLFVSGIRTYTVSRPIASNEKTSGLTNNVVPTKFEKTQTPSWMSTRIANKMLSKLRRGTLSVKFPSGTVSTYGNGEGAQADITLHDLSVMKATVRYGDIGFAESYISGTWDTNELTALLDLLIQNRDQLQSAVYGSWLGRMMYRIRHLMNRNSKEGSKRNIHVHYDIGNDFYKLWLDPTMTYSSALFNNDPSRSLPDAQIAKYRRVIEEINVRDGDRVLEIGCGWGGFAETLLREKGVSLTGVTLSTEQLEWANNRMARLGFSDKADLRLQDYRDIQGKFDAVASIEMFEAVGEQYWPSFFKCVSDSLKKDGHACIQTITIRDDLFSAYRSGTDFIQQYIFPGGMLASPSAFKEQCERAGLKIVNEYSFGMDYAKTLRLWHDAFQERIDDVIKVGLDERFIRTWKFYLCYCEAAFKNKNIDVVQYTLTHTN